MNTDAVMQAEEKAPAAGALEALDRRLANHLDNSALAVLAAGFALRLFVATRTYLNPDEALHYLLLNQPTVFLAYKASLTNAHPPLIYLVLYFWHFLGRSEVMLRFPSVLAGTAFCWFFYKWMAKVFGQAASWIGLILAAFSPAMVVLSAEVRAYALLLFCIGGTLYFLERALAEQSVREMWCFSAFLYLAILSHYSAVFFAAAAGVYVLARIADVRLPWRVSAAWAAGQAGALAIYGFLYVTHVSKIKHDEMATWKTPFDSYFFHWGNGHLLDFVKARTADIFSFLFENDSISQALLLVFVASVVLLLLRDRKPRPDRPHPKRAGILLLLPFAAVLGAAIAGIYPYASGRYTVFLFPFMIAGVSYLIATTYGHRLWAVLLFAGLVVAGAYTSGKEYEPYITPENQSRALMNGAMSHIRQSVPRGDLILVDYQSSIVLSYHLCGPHFTMPIDTFTGGDFEFTCDGYSILALRTWKMLHQDFPSEFEKVARDRGLKSGDRVWVFQSGWAANLDTELSWYNLKFRCLTPASFGENITVIPFVVGADMAPALPPGSPHLTRLMRCSN